MPIQIAPLCNENYDRWAVLARGYKTFYKTTLPDADYENTWRRLLAKDGVCGLGAIQNGQLVGIAHYLFQPNTMASFAMTICLRKHLAVGRRG